MPLLDDIAHRKIRRVFRAKQKLNAPGLVSHITQRAAGKEPLFLEDADYLYMLVLLKEICHKHAVKIYAFCLMENHIHILLRPTQSGLGPKWVKMGRMVALNLTIQSCLRKIEHEVVKTHMAKTIGEQDST